MTSVEHIRTMVLVMASLITPATRPPAEALLKLEATGDEPTS
jgi:hypothetical protein